MNKKVFTILFLALSAAPVLAMPILGPSRAGANEVLASAPVLQTRTGWNADFLGDLSDYVGDRFAFRQELVTAGASVTAAVLGESSADSVVLGSDGWLYYADTLDDYQGSSAMTERELWRAGRTLALAREYAGQRGARFLFTVAPNKNSLYPGHMPKKYPVSTQPGNWERLKPVLDELGVGYCDLFPVLSAEAEPVYYRTDSHWDGYGSALACDAIVSSLGGQSALAEEAFVRTAHRGDLYEMLFPAGTGTEQGRVLARERAFSYEGKFHAPDDLTIRTASGGEMGRLLMFRDSFGNLLHADLAEYFSSATFSRSASLRLDRLDGEGTVIYELVERNLRRLLTNAPVMPAPRREAEAAGPVAAEVTLQSSESAELPGLLCYAGTVDCPEMDVDSPVYVELDGAVYEASPAGRGAGGFTLYGPETARPAVLVRCGGQWKRCEPGMAETALTS